MNEETKEYVQRELFLAMDAGEISTAEYEFTDGTIEKL